MGKTAEEILNAQPDDEQGYQDDPGFVVDGVVGKLEIPVVLCHTKGNPTPKERVVILDGDGKYRVHDYIAVRRVSGKQVAADVWMLGQSGINKLVAILAGQLAPIPTMFAKLLVDTLNKIK